MSLEGFKLRESSGEEEEGCGVRGMWRCTLLKHLSGQEFYLEIGKSLGYHLRNHGVAINERLGQDSGHRTERKRRTKYHYQRKHQKYLVPDLAREEVRGNNLGSAIHTSFIPNCVHWQCAWAVHTMCVLLHTLFPLECQALISKAVNRRHQGKIGVCWAQDVPGYN